MASIEIGIRASHSARLIRWSEILASVNTPIVTRTASRPERISTSYKINGQTQSVEIVADGSPFGIERTHSGIRSYLFFPGIEADRSTEPIEASDADRSSIYKKILAYRAIVANGIHRTHFGFPNFFVPFVAPNKTRLKSMMQLLERVTEGRGSKIFLFKSFPLFTSSESRTAAAGYMFREPWERVGFEPLSLAG